MTELLKVVVSRLEGCNLVYEMNPVFQTWHGKHSQGQVSSNQSNANYSWPSCCLPK